MSDPDFDHLEMAAQMTDWTYLFQNSWMLQIIAEKWAEAKIVAALPSNKKWPG